MKFLFCSAILLSVLGCQALQTAPTAATAPAPAAVPSAPAPAAARAAAAPVLKAAVNTSLGGQYAGKWTSTEGTSGELRIKLRPGSAANWIGEAMFTYESADIPGTVKSIEADGSKLRMVFDWQIQGTAGQSTLVGELTGDTLKGTYETKGVAGASRGTWSATRG